MPLTRSHSPLVISQLFHLCYYHNLFLANLMSVLVALAVVHVLKICINEGKNGEPWRRFICAADCRGKSTVILCLEFIASSIGLSQRRQLRCGPAEEEVVQKRLLNIFPSFFPCVKWLGLSSPVYQVCITASSPLLLHLFVGL